MKGLVLIADDVEINRIILKGILSDDYDILEACDGLEAIEVLNNTPKLPDIVLLDIMMPNLDGYGVIKYIKESPVLRNLPVLFITAADTNENEERALHEGAMDFIVKPFNHGVVKARVDNHVELSRYHHQLEVMVEEKTRELSQVHQRILDTLATIIEYRSLESGMHIRRSTELSKAIIENLLTKDEFRDQLLKLDYHAVIKAVSLHDIGKVGIPDKILLKPGRLDDEEIQVMRTHTTIGGSIIDIIARDMKDSNTTAYLQHCKDICLYHHERWDGKGYPLGLKDLEIPLSSRIMSVVDVYDALSNKRCYKDKMSAEECMKIMVEGRGTQFDPDIIDAFLEVVDEFEKITVKFNDENPEV